MTALAPSDLSSSSGSDRENVLAGKQEHCMFVGISSLLEKYPALHLLRVYELSKY